MKKLFFILLLCPLLVFSQVKFILHNPSNNTFAADLVDKTDGVFLKYKISQFFNSTGGFNSYGTTVKNEIKSYQDKGKLVMVSVQWGSACGNAIWNNYRYIELTERRKEGSDPTRPKHYDKFPVPYDSAYLNKVTSFLAYFSTALGKDIRDKILLGVDGINEVTFELRIPNQNFKDTDDPNIAYNAGSGEWIRLGYTTEKVRESMQRLLNDYNTYFPNTVKYVSPIAGTNGFPKIDDNGNFIAQSNPSLLDDLLGYMKWFPNFSVMPTALYATGGTPTNVTASGLTIYYQLNCDKLNTTTTAYDFEHAILNGISHKGVLFQVYPVNVREHNDIIQKYRLTK